MITVSRRVCLESIRIFTMFVKKHSVHVNFFILLLGGFFYDLERSSGVKNKTSRVSEVCFYKSLYSAFF